MCLERHPSPAHVSHADSRRRLLAPPCIVGLLRPGSGVLPYAAMTSRPAIDDQAQGRATLKHRAGEVLALGGPRERLCS